MSNLTRVTVLGATHMKGISAKGPYDFATFSYLVDAESRSSSNMELTVAGLNVLQVSALNKDLVLKLSFAGLTFPCELDLDISPDPKNLTRNVVKDFVIPESNLKDKQSDFSKKFTPNATA